MRQALSTFAAFALLLAAACTGGPAFAQTASGFSPSTASITLPPTPYASLPPASANTGTIMFSIDAPGGGSLVVSDGTSWRVFGRGAQANAVTTAANCQATYTFSPAFLAAPVVQLTPVVPSGSAVETEIVSVTSTALTIRARRAQSLPTVAQLAQLGGYDTLGGVCSGLTVHFLALPPSS